MAANDNDALLYSDWSRLVMKAIYVMGGGYISGGLIQQFSIQCSTLFLLVIENMSQSKYSRA